MGEILQQVTIQELILYSIYFLDILFLFFYGMHCYFMIFLYRRNYRYCISSGVEIKDYPNVTVQLPVYNEALVIERLIHQTVRMDYPKDKLEVQVLDDSTDETQEKAKRMVAQYRRRGYDLKYIHRDERIDHKAGALREGLAVAKGEFVAVFDADFLPAREFLIKSVPYFKDPKIGMVQSRWGHVNANYSFLTRAQSIGVDGHFLVEQVARNCNNLFMNFNGTAGIWRKACIFDAGNWQADTLTEDFDLSYRAELAGWKFQYIQDVVNPAELPAHVSAYKSQQFRWAKGSIQTAVKLIPHILKSRETFIVKLEAIVHLTNYIVHPLMLINLLMGLPIILISSDYLQYSVVMVVASMLSIATFGPSSFYFFSMVKLYPDSWHKRIWFLPVLMVIGAGIALNNTRAFLEAVFGYKTPFIRTPKIALEQQGNDYQKIKYFIPIGVDTIMELGIGLYALASVLVAIYYKNYMIAPFLLIYSCGFLYIALLAVKQHFLGLKLASYASSAD